MIRRTTAAMDADCEPRERRCNRGYAGKAMRRMLTLVLLLVDVIGLIDDSLHLLARQDSTLSTPTLALSP